MWKTKYASYMYQKRGIYYFSRRIPEDLKDYYKLSRIVISLRTRSENNALRQSKIIASKLEEDWQILRVKSSSEKLAGYLVGENLSIIPGIETKQDAQDQAPLFSEAARFYMETKGINRPKVFRQSVERAVKYLLQTLDDKPISHYSRSEVNAFRDRLFERGLALARVKRNLNVVRAIVNFSSRETGIPANSVFSGIYLGEQASSDNDKKRKPIPIHVIQNIQADCCKTDDEIRWLIALISDTGLRLSEAAGLCLSDVELSSTGSYLTIRSHPWRRLKTKSSNRTVPLVGKALWAVRRASEETESKFLFPKYCCDQICKSNSASAALNKWLTGKVPDGCVIHSFRHSLRDRLRNIECPPDIIDRIGGWARTGVGENYGYGHSLEILNKWMQRMVSQHHTDGKF